MKKYFSIACALLIATASFSQNSGKNTQVQVKANLMSQSNSVNSSFKGATSKQLVGSYPIKAGISKKKTNHFLNSAYPFNTVSQPGSVQQNTNQSENILIDTRDLKLSKNGLLLSPDGYEVEFRTSGNKKVTDVCSTPRPYVIDPVSKKDALCSFSVPCDNPNNRDAADVSAIKYFQLRWHVIQDGSGAPSNIDQSMIDAMMLTLNADYAIHNMIFCEDSAEFQIDALNYTHNSNTMEVSLKTTYNTRPADLINIYVVGDMTAGGYARFPYDPMGGTNFRGGIVLNKGNCNAAGHTLAHEMGHTFGLEHTFAGVDERAQCSDCYEKVRNVNGSSNSSGTPSILNAGGTQGDQEGDWCSDTNPHNTNTYQCNTATGPMGGCDGGFTWANAPVNNHMSYSFCDSEFTTQQRYRQHCMADAYLGSWIAYGGGICGTLAPVAEFVGSPTNWQSPSSVDFTDLSAPAAIIDSFYWDFNSALNPAGTVVPATFSSTTPGNQPNVIYTLPGGATVCQSYEVTLEIYSVNGNDTVVKPAYIKVCPPSGDCDTLDFQWLTPSAGVPLSPTVVTYQLSFTDYLTGVPDTINLTNPTDAKGIYERYVTPNLGVTTIGAIRVGLGSLVDTDDDMTFQVVVYDDDGFGSPGAILGGRGGISPTAFGVPAGLSYNEQWIPLFTPLKPTTGQFHVGVEIFAQDADDALVVMTSCDDPSNCPVAEGENDTSNTIFTSGFGYENLQTVYGYDFDVDIIPMLGEYTPLPDVSGITEVVVCDTTFVTIFDTIYYTDYSGAAITGLSFRFLDGTIINTTTDPGSINRAYTSAGPDSLWISVINDCGRSFGEIGFQIDYNFMPTPDAEFTKVEPNDICIGVPTNFTANTAGYQDYNWDFGDGTVASSGSASSTTHTYTAPGSYYTTLTTTSTGPGCIGTQHKDDFVVVVDCTVFPPTADMDVSDSTGCAPLNVSFTDITTLGDPATSWVWNFGDGSFYTADEYPPAHVYTTAGTYFASFEACNTGGCTTEFVSIVVGTGVTADAGLNDTICGGTTATLAGNDPLTDIGLWTLISGPGSITADGTFNSGVTGLAAGLNQFAWTITGVGCITVDTVAIIIATPVNAGTDGALTTCSASDTTNLFTLLTGAETGGTWIAIPSALTNDSIGTFDPAVNTAGTYQYYVTGIAPCENDTADVVVTLNTTPVADSLSDTTVCDGYILPVSTVGDYFTTTGGVGAVADGINITSTQTIFVYAETGTTPNCTDENSFVVTINTTPTTDSPNDTTVCDGYVLPVLTAGDYFTTTGGVGAIAAGTNITSTQTIFIYAATGSTANCTDENSFVVTINTTPTTDSPNDTTVCDGYVLPVLTVGDYFTTTGGIGAIAAGTNITSTQTIFVYAATGSTANCTDENSFVVTINITPTADSPNDTSVCDGYVLPVLTVGDYFTTTGGIGAITAGANITSTQTIFVYAATGSTPNCTDENSFVVTINTTPTADSPNDTTVCDGYVLPVLTAGDYFTTTGGIGAIASGTNITSTQTIFVYAETGIIPNLCTDENSFIVTITAQDDASFTYSDFCAGSGGVSGGNATVGMYSFDSIPVLGATIVPGTGVISNAVGGNTYKVKYVTSGACPDSSTVTVNVGTPVSAGLDDFTSTLCNVPGSTLDLNTLLSVSVVTGTWEETSGSVQLDTATGIFDANGLAAGTYTFIYYLSSGSTSCPNDTADFTVTVGACSLPVSSFTASTLSICVGEDITFTDNSTGLNINNWAWNFDFGNVGGATPDTANTQGAHLVSFSTPGTYNIQLLITDSVGTDDTTITVTVTNCITADFTMSSNTICAGDSIVFTDASISTVPLGGWSWNFDLNNVGGILPSTMFTQGSHTVFFQDPGTYDVRLVVFEGGVIDTVIKTVTITDCRPVPFFTVSNDTICRDNSVSFTDLSTGNPTSYQWSFPGGTPSTDTTANPGIIVYDTVGIYPVYLIVTNPYGTSLNTWAEAITVIDCDSAIAGIIMTDLNGEVEDGEICLNECIQFTFHDTLGGKPDSLIWSFQGVNSLFDTVITIDASEVIEPVCWVNDSIGSFTVSLSVKNQYNNNVFNVATSTVIVHDNPIIFAGNDVTVDYGFDTQIRGEVRNSFGNIIAASEGTITWSPETFLNSPTDLGSEVIQPTDTTNYTVTFVDENGCIATDDVNVNVNFIFNIGVPSAFTPLGSSNNILYVKGKLGIKTMNFVIYNRYGQKVFETTDINQGWNGTHKGKELNPGVFVYYVKATFVNGSTGELKGNVTLIK